MATINLCHIEHQCNNTHLPCYKVFCKRNICHYRPQRSCGQGNIFTPVRHSVHRGGSPVGRTPPGPDPPCQGEPPRPDPPWHLSPPPPRRKQTAAYGQRAAGTHPTGMHSCYLNVNKLNSI